MDRILRGARSGRAVAWALVLALVTLGSAPAVLAQADEPGDDAGTAEDASPRFEIPTIVDVQVKGLVLREPRVIAERLGLRVGAPLPLPAETTRLQKLLFDDFRIFVDRDGMTFEETEGGVIVHLKVTEMPYDLDPQFVGNTSFKTEKLREWAQLGERAEVYIDEVEAIGDRIRRGYLRQGYHFVEVDWRLGGEGVQQREIVFEVREGPKVYVKGVTIEGNENYENVGFLLWKRTLGKDAGLRTKGRGFFAWFGHRYVEDVVEADRIALMNAYRARGYMDVQVRAQVDFTDDRSGAHVTFHIDEGPRYTVRSIGLRAFEVERDPTGRGEDVEREVDLVIPEDELKELLALEVGGPYEEVRMLHDRRELLDRYGEEGHLDAGSFVGPSGTAGWQWLPRQVLFDYENKTVDVTYRFQQGRPFRLRMLEIEGNLDTKDHVIRREISQLPGELIDAERLRADRNRIERTGFFSDSFAGGAHPPPEIKFKTVEGEPDLVDAIVTVEEGRTIKANLSGGVASDQGLVGIISLQVSNFDAQRLPSSFWAMPGEVYRKEAFTGDGETFGIDISPGSEVNYSRIFYQHPDLFGSHFDRIGMIVEAQLRDRIYRSHDESRAFGRLALTRAFGQGDLQGSLGVRWQSLDHNDLDQSDVLPRTLLGSAGNEEYVGLTGSLSYNRLDSARLPRSGYAVRWSNTLYGTALGSDENLWKSEFSLDRYFHLARDPFTAAPGIYLGLGAGVAVPFDEAKGSVNYGERYFAGGSRIGRGFRFRGIGPYQGDYALGGETLLRSTLEYRFPLYAQAVPGTTRRRELFRGSFFVDTVTLDPEAYELDMDETRVSAGFALGLIEPFPVTFSFGWPLRDGNGDERQVFAFSLTLR